MSISHAPDVRPGRLEAADYAQRFADATPRLSAPQAILEAERCLYCSIKSPHFLVVNGTK